MEMDRAVDYSPDPNLNISMTLSLKKINGKWQLADDARTQSCIDEKIAREYKRMTEEAASNSK
jgi:hypothetical protein